ncbi:MAG: 2-oxo acid dehydrogenase subunit E2 [Deltaproteobacteria bacterium]|nr:2-oxo acid dehydrogenase subunit E2 [Deltaproteobacteria bacterium]
MPNVELSHRQRVSPFRKIAIGTWQDAYDPSIYGSMRLRMDEAQRYIDRFREKTGRKLTVTHLVAKAVALALKECPEANAVLRWNGVYQRKHIDVSVLVVMEHEGKKDLSSAKLERLDERSLSDVVDELEARAAKIRARQDKALEGTRQSMRGVPGLFMNGLLKVLSFLLYTLNLDLRWAGLPKDALGSAVVTSIGSLGLDIGYVPLLPYARVPILVAPGRIERVPVLEGDQVVPGHMMNLSATFDHRIIDGSHAASLATTVRKVLERPFEHLEPLE